MIVAPAFDAVIDALPERAHRWRMIERSIKVEVSEGGKQRADQRPTSQHVKAQWRAHLLVEQLKVRVDVRQFTPRPALRGGL